MICVQSLKLRYYYFYLFPDTDVCLCFAWQGKFSIKRGLMFSQYLASFWSLAWALGRGWACQTLMIDASFTLIFQS